MNYSEDLIAQKSHFPYKPFGRPVAKFRTPKSEIRMLQQTLELVAQGPEEVRTAKQTLKLVSLRSHRVQTKMR